MMFHSKFEIAITASHMIIDIFIFPLFCRYIEYYLDISGYIMLCVDKNVDKCCVDHSPKGAQM